MTTSVTKKEPGKLLLLHEVLVVVLVIFTTLIAVVVVGVLLVGTGELVFRAWGNLSVCCCVHEKDR